VRITEQVLARSLRGRYIQMFKRGAACACAGSGWASRAHSLPPLSRTNNMYVHSTCSTCTQLGLK
jgi:hypothetical protein